jgi:hypothetical protein
MKIVWEPPTVVRVTIIIPLWESKFHPKFHKNKWLPCASSWKYFARRELRPVSRMSHEPERSVVCVACLCPLVAIRSLNNMPSHTRFTRHVAEFRIHSNRILAIENPSHMQSFTKIFRNLSTLICYGPFNPYSSPLASSRRNWSSNQTRRQVLIGDALRTRSQHAAGDGPQRECLQHHLLPQLQR